MTTKISPFIKEQFPAIYQEEGEFFIEFAKSYYQWLESTNNPLYHARRLPQYFDIDTTSEDFLIHFKEKYLPDFALLTETDKRTLAKHAVEIYRSKGSIRSLKLLFRLVYNDEIQVHLPGDDILRPSDSKFKIPRYLEVQAAEKTVSFIGKEIAGEVSGARAIVESVSRRTVSGTIVDVIQITNVRGNFVYDEIVTSDGIISGAPRVIGSLTTLDLLSGGRDFYEGQILDVVSDAVGFNGKAKVTSITTQSGQVQYALEYGGAGFSNTADVLISEKVFEVSDVRGSIGFLASSSSSLVELENIEQPLVTTVVASATGPFPVGRYVAGANSTDDFIAFGAVANTTQNSTSYATGTIIISDRRVSTIVLDTITSGDPVTSSFDVGTVVYQRALSGSDILANTAVGYVFGANSTAILIDTRQGVFEAGHLIYSQQHATTANAASVTVTEQRFTNGTISQYNLLGNNALLSSVDKTATIGSSAQDRTATGQYMASNATHIGVINISPTASFIATPAAPFRSLASNVYANVTSISSGNVGSFDVVSVNNDETLYVNTDRLYVNNSSGDLMSTVAINATSYGLEGLNSANLNTLLIDALTYERKNFGPILLIGDIDPGSFNTIAPLVLVREPTTAPFARGDYQLQLTDRNAIPFIVGEAATTTFERTVTTIECNTVTGNTGFNLAGVGESVYQVKSDGTWAYGTVISQNTASSPKQLVLVDVYVAESQYGPRTPGNFDTSNDIIGIASSAAANDISSVANTDLSVFLQGRVKSANGEYLIIERTRFASQQDRLVNITGSISGATANILAYEPIFNSPVYGMSADVSSNAGIGTGIATQVTVADSGFAYAPGETVTLRAANNPYSASAVARVTRHGVGQGYWDTSDSFISDEKKVQDSDYYQEHSYEIRSSLSKVVYEQKVFDIAHVAGTKMFGAVYSSQIANSVIDAVSTNTTYQLAVSNTGLYGIGETVRDETSNTYGVVVSKTTSSTDSFDGYGNVINGGVASFNSNSAITKGYNSPFNANLGVSEGRTIRFNANADVVQSVDFTVNGVANVSNVVSTTFNSSSNVYPGIFIDDFGSVSARAGNTLVFNANVIITSYNATFNANSDVANSTTIVFNANTDVNSGRLVFNGNTSITAAITTGFRVDSTKTKTIYYQVLDHYNPVEIGQESYWEPSFGYKTVVTGKKTVTGTRPVQRSYTYISSYRRVATGQVWGITGTESVWVSSGKSGGYYETRNTYGWITTYTDQPVYSTGSYTDYETYTYEVDVTAQQQATRTRPVYRYDPVYRTESYTEPNTEVLDYFTIASANTTYAVGDVVRYHVSPNFNNGAATIGNAISNLIEHRAYTVLSANTTAIRLRDHTINGTGNTLPIEWKKIFNQTPVTHYFTLLSGKSIEGANSFITLTNANSYFAVDDVITYSTEDAYATRLLDHSSVTLGYIANNANLYVESVNSTGISLKTSIGGGRLPLTKGLTSNHAFTGYNRLAGTIATSDAALFSNGDTIVYRVAAGNNSIAQLQHQKSYYIKFANSTHMALSRTATGPRIAITKGMSESGHILVSTKAGNGIISVANASNYYTAGDSVKYYVESGNTPLASLTNNQIYYIQFANASHIALSNTKTGPRIELNQGATEGGHHLVGTNEIVVDNPFRIGDYVQYAVPTGQTAISNLSSNVVYQIGFSDSHMIRLTETNSIDTITINNGGLGYSNDDIITIVDKNPHIPATFQLQTNSTGGITGYTLIHAGLGYRSTPTVNMFNVSSGVTANGANLTVSLTGTANIALAKEASSAGHRLTLVNRDTNVLTVDNKGLTANSIILYYTSNGTTAISGITNNTLYYVDSAGQYGISLKSTTTGARIRLAQGTSTNGHFIVLAGANNTIKTDFANSVANGDLVQYVVDVGNTAIVPLENRNTYYVAFANATHLALSTAAGSPRLTMLRGKFETGHSLYKVSGDSGVIATSYAANLVAGDVVRYIDGTGTTPISPLISNAEYYIQFANTTHIALANTDSAPRLWLTTGSGDSGHQFIGQKQKSTIVTTVANTFVVGDTVKYVTASGNTPMTGFTNGSTYYVQFANDTHVALSSTREGDRINLFKGTTESGHYFSPTSTPRATIRSLNGFTVGDTVQYAFTSSNTGLIGVANNTTYYIEHANSTHFALSEFSGGPRIDLRKGLNEAGHSVFTVGAKGSISVGNTASDFANGDQVRYYSNTGTNLPGLINGGVYYIQFANATHIAVSPTVGGFRIPIDKGLTETGHKIVKTGPHSLIVTDFAANLSVGEPITYTSADPLEIRPSGALVSGTTYYVEFSNATHLAISATPGGERLAIVQQASSGTDHTLVDAVINNIAVSVTTQTSNAVFTPGSNVQNMNTASSQTIANVSVLL